MSRKLKVLHFADAHIDMANWGRHDPQTGLPVRVMDFLHSLDRIVDAAIDGGVDLVLFAGDAYKDRNPQPTFQREWGRRIMRLAEAEIPTVLLVGNHDVAPALGRAHTMQEFRTLNVPYIHIADDFLALDPADLGIPVKILAIPWVSRSKMMRREAVAGKTTTEIFTQMEDILRDWMDDQLAKASDEPRILLAHASVEGAKYGTERMVMLGQEMVLSGGMVRDSRLDYVALGHIHKHQSLNGDRHPPAVYPGSIERIDFGEAGDKKGYVLAEVGRGETTWEFVPLPTRPFYDLSVEVSSADQFMAEVMAQLPAGEKVAGAMVRVRLTYPYDWEALVDEQAIYAHLSPAFNVQIQKNRQVSRRARLGDTAGVESLSHEELLNIYWQTIDLDTEETEAMQGLARDLFAQMKE
jgi:exonuclease SbcD